MLKNELILEIDMGILDSISFERTLQFITPSFTSFNCAIEAQRKNRHMSSEGSHIFKRSSINLHELQCGYWQASNDQSWELKSNFYFE